jgi:hypothetical protein
MSFKAGQTPDNTLMTVLKESRILILSKNQQKSTVLDFTHHNIKQLEP